MKIDFEIKGFEFKGLKISGEGEISQAVASAIDELAATAQEGLSQLRAELKARAAGSANGPSPASE